MLSLQEIYDADPLSDKGTVHSYIGHYYEQALERYRNSAEKVLEIGVLEGGSTRLWRKYFSKAAIVGIDITKQEPEPGITYVCGDAYDISTLSLFEQEFDVIIDDGPHTLQSQIIFISEWYTKLKPGGLLVIEDIQSTDDAVRLITFAQNQGHQIKLIDLRHVKGRYDDLLIEIIKPQCPG